MLDTLAFILVFGLCFISLISFDEIIYFKKRSTERAEMNCKSDLILLWITNLPKLVHSAVIKYQESADFVSFFFFFSFFAE